jgi:predicted RNA-binding protein YlxR (DUF448 family)
MAQVSSNKGAPRQKQVPQRTCIACRRSDAKRGLIRVVRHDEGRVSVDPTGRRNGRGAYLCHDRLCWTNALKRKALERALRLEQLHPDDRAALLAFAQSLALSDAPEAQSVPAPEPQRQDVPGPTDDEHGTQAEPAPKGKKGK